MMNCCGNCGVKKEGDDIKLRTCAACKSVSYCGVKCQKEHWSKHKRACKARAAELRDEILFQQPESSCWGDCPICFLPLSLDVKRTSSPMNCCSKLICHGCDYANWKREFELGLPPRCPFCRTLAPTSPEESEKRTKERAAQMNDPVAMREEGIRCSNEGDYQTSLKYISKAAEMGDSVAHLEMSGKYMRGGRGVEKNESKRKFHLEESAIRGNPMARLDLGSLEFDRGNREKGVKHWIIAAKLGFEMAMMSLDLMHSCGTISDEELEDAKAGYQAAIDEMQSPQRKAAEEERRRVLNEC